MTHTVKYTIMGNIPEKQFVLKRKDGKIEQDLTAKRWEFEVKQTMKGLVTGWLSRSDETYGEYTPLRMDVKIYTPKKTVIIKQLKTLLDALTGVVYMDDCVIVDLKAERFYSPQAYTELYIEPANKERVQLPTEKPVILDRYLKPLKATVWDVDGYPLDSKKHKEDNQFRRYIRSEFAAQNTELILGDFDLFAVIGAAELKERTPLKDRHEAYNLDSWPITTPDADNAAYNVLQALLHHEFDRPSDLRRLHIIKTYYNPDCGRNRIWLRNDRWKDEKYITIKDNFKENIDENYLC